MANILKVNGVEGCDAVKVGETEISNILTCAGKDYTTCAATRWMAGANTGRVFSTTASNGLNGWGDGLGTNGSLLDLGNGDVETVAYGRSSDDALDPDRWIVGLNLKSGPFGAIVYINSGSGIDGAGRPYYTTSSNWTSGSAPEMVAGFQGVQGIGYGNDIWMGAGQDENVSGDYRTFYRSSNYGVFWTRLIESNDEADEAMAVCYKGTGDTWLAAHGKSIWRSTDNGANWTRVLTGGTATWTSIAYDGAGRWMIVGNSGDALYTDDDGDNFVDQSSKTGTSLHLMQVVYMKGSVNRWIAVGQNGVGKSQTNAAIDEGDDNWTNMSPPDSTSMNAIATDHKTAVAVGQSGRIWATTNGTSWTAAVRADNVGTNALKSIACDIIGSGIYK